MDQSSPASSDRRSDIRYACVAAAVTIVLLWTLYLIRAPLLVIYVSALFATGLAPLVLTIERRTKRLSKRRVPRPAAILVIYAMVIGTLAAIAAAVVPPMVRQSQEFWAHLPDYMDSAQQKLESWCLIAQGTSFKLLSKAPPKRRRLGRPGDVVGICRRHLRLVTILLLTFYCSSTRKSVRASPLSAPRSKRVSKSAGSPPRRSARGSAARCCSD
jgi:hypothetical protein